MTVPFRGASGEDRTFEELVREYKLAIEDRTVRFNRDLEGVDDASAREDTARLALLAAYRRVEARCPTPFQAMCLEKRAAHRPSALRETPEAFFAWLKEAGYRLRVIGTGGRGPEPDYSYVTLEGWLMEWRKALATASPAPKEEDR